MLKEKELYFYLRFLYLNVFFDFILYFGWNKAVL